MATNPSLLPEQLNNPTQRANEINDPQFQNQQGYFGYDLTHAEYCTPRFSEVTPTLNLDTVPADRFVVHDNQKLVLNQINGNLLSTINQYVDSFYVPLRSVFPINYEKLIPNPTKGDDLPLSALPQIPLFSIIRCMIDNTLTLPHPNGNNESLNSFTIISSSGVSKQYPEFMPSYNFDWSILFGRENSNVTNPDFIHAEVVLGRMLLVAYVLSRGQLLDYLGISLDQSNGLSYNMKSELQRRIDDLFGFVVDSLVGEGGGLYSMSVDLTRNELDYSTSDVIYALNSNEFTRSSVRQAISDIFERGEHLMIHFTDQTNFSELSLRYNALLEIISQIITDYPIIPPSSFDKSLNSFLGVNFVNGLKLLAYQQSVAQFYVNNSVDNVFTSELFMQNLRSVMFPSTDGYSKEPTFEYNGVSTEYDLMTYGACYSSLLRWQEDGFYNRQYVWLTLLCILRRSLRYGDYFATARPNMLAVGQLSIPLNDSVNGVSPIDVTQNLLKQRYLNAANYIGSGVLQWYASMYGVTPSDMGSCPRFIGHRKIELQNQITNNTADNQGAQTTNIVGYADNNAFDVFVDDFGFIFSLVSFDVLPVYCSGIDSSYLIKDRFDYFNPMLQNMGDIPILLSELYGNLHAQSTVFGYTMRDAVYKFKKSRAHGAFCNSLPGFLVKYPYGLASPESNVFDYRKISPDFIRDKACILDPLIPSATGNSPGDYFHFVLSVVNQVHAARKIQATPPVLF